MSCSTDQAAPTLIGLAIDVSGSMADSIQNTDGPDLSRLQASIESIKSLVERGRDRSPRDGCPARIFAYGYGFGNPLTILFGSNRTGVIDLLNIPNSDSSLSSMIEIADRWSEYEAHISDLSVDMFGDTPMFEVLTTVLERFEVETSYRPFKEKILFLLSDGLPNKGTSESVYRVANEIRETGVAIISCYITSSDDFEPRHLYRNSSFSWADGAKLMFECASPLDEKSPIASYLSDQGWTLEHNSRLFAQINSSEILKEYLSSIADGNDTTSSFQNSSGKRILISYSHKDEAFRISLEKHLSTLRRNGVVSTWSDREIGPGEEWKGEINSAIEKADIILLLVSENFVNSDYCFDVELKRAMERHNRKEAVVIPVIVRPVDWKGTPFEKLQALPRDGKAIASWRNRSEAFLDVAQGVRRAIEKLS